MSNLIGNLLSTYDKNMLPNNTNGTMVTLEIHISGFSSISETTGDFELDIMYSEIWEDKKLSYAHMNVCKRNLTLKPDIIDKIWTPDTCIVNSKSALKHHSPSENSFVILYSNGTVWVNYRMLVTAPCKVNLYMFPFDTQECHLIIESYSYNSQEVQLRWFPKAVNIPEQVTLPDFDLVSHAAGRNIMEYPNGYWEQLHVNFTFSRRYGFYLFQAYFPTTLTVLSAWISFFLDTKSVSARITLGVSSLLALTFQFGTVLRHLPRVSYIKCIDVWMITCVMFIFLSMIELAVVCHYVRREREFQLAREMITRWRIVMKREQREAARKVSTTLSTKAASLKPISPTPSQSQIAAAPVSESPESKARAGPVQGLPLNNGTLSVMTDETDVISPSFQEATPAGDASAQGLLGRVPCIDRKRRVWRLNPLVQFGRRIQDRYAAFKDNLFAKKIDPYDKRILPKMTARKVDNLSMIGFPAMFVTFNLFYWSYYYYQYTRN